MSTADLILLGLVLLSALIGLVRGLIKELLSLLTWGAAIGLGIYFAPLAAPLLGGTIAEPALRIAAAFAAIFIATLVVGALLRWLIGTLVESTGLSGTDRFLGFLFGGARGLIVCLVVLIAIRPFAEGTAWWRTSVIAPELLAFEGLLLDTLGRSRDWLSQVRDGE